MATTLTSNYIVAAGQTALDNAGGPVFRLDQSAPAAFTLVNEGVIRARNGADTIQTFGVSTMRSGIGNVDVIFDNRGLVEVTSTVHDAEALSASNSAEATLINTGEIRVTAVGPARAVTGNWRVPNNEGDVFVTSTENGAIAFFHVQFFQNSGNVIASSDLLAMAAVINVQGQTFVNSGLLRAQTLSGGLNGNGIGLRIEAGAVTEPGYESTVINHGEIVGGGWAIQSVETVSPNSNASEIVKNYGVITGNIDLYRGGDRIENGGVITGDIIMGIGDDTIIGLVGGTIVGNVAMGDGADTFDNTLGVAISQTITMDAGNDTFIGSSGVDSVLGGIGDDTLRGNAGADALNGGSGVDTIYGGDDNDVLVGETGADVLYGDNGADVLDGGTNNDTIDGGRDVDVSTYAVASTTASWHRNDNGSWTVSTATLGVDTVSNVEYLDFTDRDVFLDRASSTFSGDGTSDIFMRHSSGSLGVWFVNSAGVAGAAGLGALDAVWGLEGVGDFNGDGRDDILMWNDNGFLGTWFMNGPAISGAAGVGAIDKSAWSIEAIGDLNGDTRDDILMWNDNGTLGVWLMNGGVAVGAGLGNVDKATFDIEGLGDFNGDGKDDILWKDVSGNLGVWFMNGASANGAGLGNIGVEWGIEGLGDFNGDGRDDILMRHDNGTLGTWLMNGGAPSGLGLGAVSHDWILNPS